MATHGPAPALRSVKILRGESRPSRLGPPVVEPALAMPARPGDLPPAVAIVWDELALNVDHTRLTCADAALARAFCEAVVILETLTEAWHAGGAKVMIRSRAGEVVPHPLLAAIDKARGGMQLAAREIGMVPVRRTSVRTRAASLDDFSEFLDRPKAARPRAS